MNDFPIMLCCAFCPSRHAIRVRAYNSNLESHERAEAILREQINGGACRHCGEPLEKFESVPTGFATLDEGVRQAALVNGEAVHRAMN